MDFRAPRPQFGVPWCSADFRGDPPCTVVLAFPFFPLAPLHFPQASITKRFGPAGTFGIGRMGTDRRIREDRKGRKWRQVGFEGVMPRIWCSMVVRGVPRWPALFLCDRLPVSFRRCHFSFSPTDTQFSVTAGSFSIGWVGDEWEKEEQNGENGDKRRTTWKHGWVNRLCGTRSARDG